MATRFTDPGGHSYSVGAMRNPKGCPGFST